MELGSQLGPQNRQIHPFIRIRSKEPEVYSHPHSTPQRIPMGNHKMEHHRPQVNTTSSIMLKLAIVETRKPPARIGVI
jgi:hypothetical protein